MLWKVFHENMVNDAMDCTKPHHHVNGTILGWIYSAWVVAQTCWKLVLWVGMTPIHLAQLASWKYKLKEYNV